MQLFVQLKCLDEDAFDLQSSQDRNQQNKLQLLNLGFEPSVQTRVGVMLS